MERRITALVSICAYGELDTGFYHVARIKQWLRYLDKEYPEAVQLFDILKTEHGYEGLKQHIIQAVKF